MVGLTPKTEELWQQVIRHFDDWFTRADVENLLGKMRLSSHDITKLDMLCDAGFLNKRVERVPNGISKRVEYLVMKKK